MTCRAHWIKEQHDAFLFTRSHAACFTLASMAPETYIHKYIPHLALAAKSWWDSITDAFSHVRVDLLNECQRGLLEGCVKSKRLGILNTVLLDRMDDHGWMKHHIFDWALVAFAQYGTVPDANYFVQKFNIHARRMPESYGLIAAKHLNLTFLADWHLLFGQKHYADLLPEMHILCCLRDYGNIEWALLFDSERAETRAWWRQALHECRFDLMVWKHGTFHKYYPVVASLWPWYTTQQKDDIKQGDPAYTWPSD